MLAGLNAENEILHTLAFLAGVIFWSEVGLDFIISLFKNSLTLICIFCSSYCLNNFLIFELHATKHYTVVSVLNRVLW